MQSDFYPRPSEVKVTKLRNILMSYQKPGFIHKALTLYNPSFQNMTSLENSLGVENFQ